MGAETPQDVKPQVLVCQSEGARKHCPADVSGGVALLRSTGEGACVLGHTWGYDDSGVWVTNGCGGEFTLGRAAAAPAKQSVPEEKPARTAGASNRDRWMSGQSMIEEERPTWGALDTSGQGISLYESDLGQVAMSAYALVRYIDQRPAEQSFVDHLGNEHPIDTRRDIQFHRAMIHVKGWFYSPKLRYQITVWTVMSTDQTTLYGFLGYQFNKKFNLYAGINTLGGSRSVMGSHPLWLANDRVMADEFFRGSFTGTFWANGEILPGLWYHLATANNLSQLGVTASQLSRDLGTGFGLWWMPTTHEFGPNGAYGDWEYHEQLATRFGFFRIRSRENSQELTDHTPENTQVRLADSVLLFQPGALAPGVSVAEADWESWSADLGFKYRGMFLQTELYWRSLDHFVADGPLPVSKIDDHGFYVQAAFFPIKQKLELYAATSWVYGDKDAGFDTSHEYIIGGNFYPFGTRKARVNAQIIDVTRSAVSSVFGFYVGGQTGTTYSVAASILF
ncbi:MAG TPA: DUF3011 domain-containing protein [Steroidobacteraceae bacterium]|jgi:hypothetical protein|nr:DUF3011 domain-containing protein [Steroidobacteraceae bacterium]